MQLQLKDNVKAHILQTDGSYEKIDKRGKTLVNSQELFCEEAIEGGKSENDVIKTRRFIPEERVDE